MKVRPPKNEQLNLARDLIWRKDQGYDVWKDDIEWAILRALCGIGEMVQELREDQECYDERMTTQRSLQIGDHVRINEYSAIFKISHFDELGMQAYLLPAPTVRGGAQEKCVWRLIEGLILVEVAE